MKARLRLPPLVRHSHRGLIYVLYWAPFIAVYQLTNRWPLVTPRELPFTAVDALVPFVPALVPLYVAYLPLYWWTVARLENDREVNRIFYAAHLQLLLSVPFFVLWPVRMPRELYYGPEIYNWADAFWRWFDAPNNCFPSLHAANCLLFLQFNWDRRGRWTSTALVLGVIVSTVLVKQHYVLDLAGGAAVYLVARAFLARLEITGLTREGWVVSRERMPAYPVTTWRQRYRRSVDEQRLRARLGRWQRREKVGVFETQQGG
jgi:membrane-associated phospholipid phosphatase